MAGTALEAAYAIYQSLLRRDPDPNGVNGVVHTLTVNGLGPGLETAITSMVASEEYKSIIHSEFDYALALREKPGRVIDGKEVSHIISLGTHCQTSSILKKYGLKIESYPFDWLFNSPSAILHSVNDDFATFLDQSQYKSLPPYEGEPRAQHNYYLKNHGVEVFFPHRDPTTNTDYAFFQRCVHRFRAAIGSDTAKLFVIISREEHDLVNRFDELHDWVRKIGHANILAIQLREPNGNRAIRKLKVSDCGDLYEFTPISTEAGVGFPDLLDDLSVVQLVMQYKIASSARSV
ncbi:hypothetical protein GGR39_003292 [Novosphingobium fluoreni]|uniref:Uncharacterized protein n=1 Tax=Novosphingobium fluoreni TaxID=1391222 RepID=A0A7W6FZS3_9SPHN|nr:DUF1796 family putative cysteine peptidase [Novosphingobium fluoreni]MBB3941611.1 hypothetical protein [Novosphingobium fluoreni]